MTKWYFLIIIAIIIIIILAIIFLFWSNVTVNSRQLEKISNPTNVGITFDHFYYGIGYSGKLILYDPSVQNLSNVNVTVKSNSDPIGTKVMLNRDNTGNFSNTVNFIGGASGNNNIHVSPGDMVFAYSNATYLNSNGTMLSNAMIYQNDLPAIFFNNASYSKGSFGSFTVIDPSAGSNTISVQLTSNADTLGIPLLLKETGPGTGIYAPPLLVQFSNSTNSSTISPAIHVNDNDTVTARYGSTIASVNTVPTPKSMGGIGGTEPSSTSLGTPTNVPNTNANCAIYGNDPNNDGICAQWVTSTGGLNIDMGLGTPYRYTACGGGFSSLQKLWMPMDDDISDYSGNYNNGVVSEGTANYEPGKYGQAFVFNGATSIKAGNSNNFNFAATQPFSVSFWTKSTQTGWKYYLEKTDNSEQNGWVVLDNGNILAFYFWQNSGNGISTTWNVNPSDGRFHHIVITYDGSTKAAGVHLYFDNSLITNNPPWQDNLSPTTILSNTNSLTIGSRIDGLINFVGDIDDVQIWNYNFSSNDVNTLYLGQQLVNTPQKLWMPMDYDILDYSGSNHNGLISEGTANYEPGPYGQSFKFDGSTSIDVTNSNNFNFAATQPFSVSFWTKSTQTGWKYYLEKTDNSEQNGWVVLHNGSVLEFYFWMNSGNGMAVTSNINPADGKNHFIVITYNGNGDASGVTFYDNNTQANTNSPYLQDNLVGNPSNTNMLKIGSRIDNKINFVGDISDVQVWNIALSTYEINNLFLGQQITDTPSHLLDPVCPSNYGGKDLFLKVSYFTGFQPQTQALLDLINVFAAHGIRLHIQEDGSPISGSQPQYMNIPADYNIIKTNNFASEVRSTNFNDPLYIEKSQVFHNALFANQINGYPGTSGYGEILGNDMIISLGGWPPDSVDIQEGTLMHELGHNLGLSHGGPTSDTTTNCKPNYLSVMSYSRQFSSLFPWPPTGEIRQTLDYSESQIGQETENSLTGQITNVAINPKSNYTYTIWGNGLTTAPNYDISQALTGTKSSPASNSITWEGAGTGSFAPLDIDGLLNPGAIGPMNQGQVLCSVVNTSNPSDSLNGWDDWDHLQFYYRGSSNFDAGLHSRIDNHRDMYRADYNNFLVFFPLRESLFIQSLPPLAFSNTLAAHNFVISLNTAQSYFQHNDIQNGLEQLKQASYSCPSLGLIGIYSADQTDICTALKNEINSVSLALPKYIPPNYEPSSPASLISTAMSPTQINLNWTSPTDFYNVTGYRIENSTDGVNFGLWGIIQKPVTHVTLTNLEPSTTYDFKVYAINAMGTSSPSVASSKTLPPEAPQSPASLVATPISGTQIDISWHRPYDGGSPITSYYVRVYDPLDNLIGVYTLPSSITIKSVHSLLASTNYTINIEAINVIGTSSPAIISATTLP